MTDHGEPTKGFRPLPRRRARVAAGIALGAAAIAGNLVVYSSLDRTEPAVQVVRDVPAGEMLTAEMLRAVDVHVDPSVNVIAGAELDRLVGQYARVRLVSGSLVTHQALQPGPLVSAGHAVVAIEVSDGTLPVGVRERVPVRLVIPADGSTEQGAIVSIDGRVVGLPTDSSTPGTRSLSVEVAVDAAPTVAAADDVRVVLMVPAEDPAAGVEQ